MVTFPVFSLTLFFLLYCLFPCLPSLCKLKPSQAIAPAFQLQFKPSQAIVPTAIQAFSGYCSNCNSSLLRLLFQHSNCNSSLLRLLFQHSNCNSSLPRLQVSLFNKEFLNSTSLSLVHPGLPASVISSCMTLSWSSPLGRDTFTRQYTFMSKPSLA